MIAVVAQRRFRFSSDQVDQLERIHGVIMNKLHCLLHNPNAWALERCEEALMQAVKDIPGKPLQEVSWAQSQQATPPAYLYNSTLITHSRSLLSSKLSPVQQAVVDAVCIMVT